RCLDLLLRYVLDDNGGNASSSSFTSLADAYQHPFKAALYLLSPFGQHLTFMATENALERLEIERAASNNYSSSSYFMAFSSSSSSNSMMSLLVQENYPLQLGRYRDGRRRRRQHKVAATSDAVVVVDTKEEEDNECLAV